jgi:hypothetical protein
MTETRITGGCQCGAVRFALASAPTGVALCHCRMCQKATGGPFLASGGVPMRDLTWTRGAPAVYASSSLAERGFCAACGTPLTFRYPGKDRISITLGSIDEPDAVPPTEHIGVESRVAWWIGVETLPARTTNQDQPGLRVEDFQHPDHDTGNDWRPHAMPA